MSLAGAKKKLGKYQNPIPTHEAGFDKLIPILKDYISNKEETVPKNTLGPFKTHTSVYKTPSASGLRITWVGHSSLLIEIDGKVILTDPVWSDRASFSQFFGQKRFFQPPITMPCHSKPGRLVL